MLVSKIKPCMYKYTPLYGETANGSLNQLLFLRSYTITWITVVILELIHETMPQFRLGADLLEQDQPSLDACLVTLDNLPDRTGLTWRRIFQVSALSTDVGELHAHHGDNG